MRPTVLVMVYELPRRAVGRSVAALGVLLVMSLFGVIERASACVLKPPTRSVEAQLSSPARQESYASVVSTDIDTDGDLDVVAVDHALQLFVWVNDGAGHLVKQSPKPASHRYRDVGVPGVDDRGADGPAWMLDRTPWINLDVQTPLLRVVVFSDIRVIPPSTLPRGTTPGPGTRAPPQLHSSIALI